VSAPPHAAVPEPALMSLGDHLDELRLRLLLALGGFGVALILALRAGKWFAGVILSPYSVAMASAGIEARLQAIQPAEPFLVYIKAAMVLAVLISSPWVFYQFWAFVSAGLLPNEKRLLRRLAPVSAGLFAGGVLFFLRVVGPLIFRFFMQFDLGIDFLTYQPGVGRTLDFILLLALVFGVGFEMPMAIVMAERTGLIAIQTLQRARKGVFLGIVVLAAMATPPDVISQLALGLPLYALYEGGMLVCRLWPRPI